MHLLVTSFTGNPCKTFSLSLSRNTFEVFHILWTTLLYGALIEETILNDDFSFVAKYINFLVLFTDAKF